jgi:NAD+ diphosphatase
VLVAGYIKPGESAEDAARREITEETGLTVTALRYVASYPHMDGNMLMLGFAARAEGAAAPASGEVVSSRWANLDNAVVSLREGSIAQQVVIMIRNAQSFK